MGSRGSPYTHFQGALRAGNLLLIETGAAEVGRVALNDALAICLVMHAQDDPRYPRAAVRWLARFMGEHPDVEIQHARSALEALDLLQSQPAPARHALTELCERHQSAT